jgi:hypothetical protein
MIGMTKAPDEIKFLQKDISDFELCEPILELKNGWHTKIPLSDFFGYGFCTIRVFAP